MRFLSIRTLCGALFFTSVIIMTGFSIIELSPAIILSYIVFGVAGLIISYILNRKSSAVFLSVYSLSTIITVLLYYNFLDLYGLPYWLGGSDELEYERLGKVFSENYKFYDYGSIRGELVPVWHNSVGYIYIVGILTKLGEIFGGGHTMVIRLFNSLCLGLISVIIYSLAGRLELKNNTTIWTALILASLPIMLWTSAQSLRDIIISMLLVSGVYIWSPLTSGKIKYSVPYILIGSMIIIVILFELRKAQAFVMIIIVTVGLFTTNDKSYRKLRVLWISIIGIVGAWLYMKYSFILQSDLRYLLLSADTYSTYRSEVRGGGLSNLVFNSEPPLSYLLRTIYALMTPFPVLSSKLYVLFISIGTIIQLLYLPFLVNGIYLSSRKRCWHIVLLAFFMLFIGMAFFTFTSRHIVQFLPLGVLITALGYEGYNGNRKLVLYNMAIIIVIMAIAYINIKLFIL